MNNTEYFAIGAIMLLLFTFCGGCVQQSLPIANESLTVIDLIGRTVSVPKHPERIVGIGAGALRLITYLQATETVVGVDERDARTLNQSISGMPSGIDKPYMFAHPELADLPFLGSLSGNPELIAAQHPDVVFITWATAQDANQLQEKAGVPVIALTSGDLGQNKDAFYQSLRIMGQVLGREERAEEVIAYLDATMQDLSERTEDIPQDQKPRVYIGGIAFRGAHGLLSTEPSYPALAMVNGNNVASQAGSGQVIIDKEKLLEWNPEIIFIDEASYSLIINDLQDPAFQSIAAIRNGEVYGVMPYNWYANNYDTVLADAYFIGKVIYPERFADIDPEEKADEIYEALAGAPVYEHMKELFGGFGKIR